MKVVNTFKQTEWDDYFLHERKIQVMPKAGLFTSYDIYLCDSIIQKNVPKFEKENAKICEIGSGDGRLLKKLAVMLGCQPYGVEYSKETAKESIRSGIKVIIKDAFDKNFLKKYKNYFDVVYSYGFLEHILPPEKAVKIHYEILKPGGYAIIQIPRFKGFNLLKAKILRPEIIPFHNLDIMNADLLKRVCQDNKIEAILCQNYGTFKFRFPMDKKNKRYFLLKAFCLLEYITNPLMRILFGSRGFETNFFSPAVIFIGKKKNEN